MVLGRDACFLKGVRAARRATWGIIVKASLIDFAREPGEPENFKSFEFFEGFSEVVEELRVGKIEW